MSSREFYRDRITWRAERNSLLGNRCALYPDITEDSREILEKALDDDVDPVIVFWHDKDLWTVLGTGKVCSFSNGLLACEEIDRIGKQVRLEQADEGAPGSRKLRSSFILVGREGKRIWAPAGPKAFALMNILLMFPLKGGASGARAHA